MSNKSGVSGQVISLPKGGGALKGIGEKFSPDLHTGTGNFTVPIALLPGRNGLQPELNLVYSTGNGNGLFGLGWSMNVPGVGRETSKGVPRYDDAEDTFILSGAEDLVPVERRRTWTRYRPRTEGLFARIDHHHDPNNDYWEVRSKDGLVSYYGTEGRAGADPAVVADPADRNKVFAWKLAETKDPFGNRIVYTYERDAFGDGVHHSDQLYLRWIRYVDYEDERGREQFLVSVEFEYEDLPERYGDEVPALRRVYPFSDYRAGFEIRTRRRCKRIMIRTHAGQERLVRAYELVYLDERVASGDLPETVLPRNGVSLLSQIRVVGHDGDRTEELPPLEFGYTRFEPEGRDFFPLEGRDRPVRSLASPDLELADLFGNGLPDVLQMNGTVRYWRNLGSGTFDLPREMREAPAGLQLGDPGVQLLDANGDGRIDLLVTSNGLSGYFPLRFDGEWDRRSFRRYQQAPSFNLQDPEVRLVDLDGDGVTDAIRSGSRLECFFNDPEEGWNGTRRVERRAVEAFPNVNFSDPRLEWADMSGDGLQDIVLVHDGSVEYWPNLGRGNWGRRTHMRNSSRLPYGYDPSRILLGDVDGDGLADLVYVDHCKVTLWINQCGHGFSDPIEIDGTPPVTDMDAVRLVDMLGTGIGGVLWSADADGRADDNMLFLDLTGGLKPYLLGEMDNHMGAVTRVEYRPSTEFYLEDRNRPETRWQTPLPFPVHVVSHVEVIDEISGGKLTTEYRYHHGYWDGAEREFRGFGMVEQLDTETFEHYNAPGLHGEAAGFSSVDAVHFSPPTLTKTWFHQGPIGEEFGEWHEADYSQEFWPGDPPLLERPASVAAFLQRLSRRAKRDALRALRSRVLRTELYALDGTERQHRPYTVTESSYGLREESSMGSDEGDRLRIFFPHVLSQRTTQWERGDEPMTQYSFTGDYDAYGQSQSQISIAVPRNQAGQIEPYLATHTRTDYAQRDDNTHYIVDRVARTTAHEIVNDGSSSITALHAQIEQGSVDGQIVRDRRLIGQTLTFYDGPAFQGLTFGQIGDYGALVRTETLVLTSEILHEAYRSGDRVLNPPEVPPYLARGGPPAWTPEYPQAFRARLPTLAGYAYQAGGAGSAYAAGYFAATDRRSYDFQDNPGGPHRGLPVTTRDPLGHDTVITYDAYDLLPVRVTDPAGLTTAADYDYRVFQPHLVTDPNGNRRVFGFAPLGLPAWIAVMGKDGENAGDTPARPGTRFEYDFLAFADSPPEARQPISVRTIRRVHHVHDLDVPLPEREETIETVEYSDGFGQMLQTRAQGEDVRFGNPVFGGDLVTADQNDWQGAQADVVGRQRTPNGPVNVVVSGWQTYDNKDRIVEKYEPFFSTGWDYAQPGERERGQKATMYYDPRGQIVRTVKPDGSEQRVIYGVPVDLSSPERFTPTPWEAYTYDENDNAGRTHRAGSQSYRHHWDTPTSIEIDALGRTIRTVERNGPDPNTDWYTTAAIYDIRGNVVEVIDPQGRSAFRYVYDLANHLIRIDSVDAGIRRTVLDAAGNETERQDSKGALVLQVYDVLLRPSRLWARDAAGEPVTLRERLDYGDGGDPNQDANQRNTNRSLNRLGQPYRHYDEAGLLTFEAYDFRGNILEKIRRVILDEAILSAFPGPGENPPPGWRVRAFRVDWQPPAGTTITDHAAALLDVTRYRTSITYDALSRVRVMRYPRDVVGGRRELRPRYNRAGALEQVELNGASYVERIAYNAKGQRTLIAYGNGVMTRYAYDPQTFRLARMRTERYIDVDALIYRPNGGLLQDFAYQHDLTGNIATIRDRTPGSGILNTRLGTDALDRAFAYDPLYRLLSATGRECDIPPDRPPWDDRPRCVDISRVRAYTEQYQYDRVGNLTQMQHTAGAGSFTRTLAPVPDSNRLATLTVGNGFNRRSAYAYDSSGNLTQENTGRHFEWDHSDRMKAFRTQPDGAEPSVHAHYLYDGGGQRVKKLVRRQGGGYEVTIYIDRLFEHHRRVYANNQQENNTLHVMDDQSRIATRRVGVPFPDDNTPAIKYHLGDHLGSSNVVIDDAGAWVNREEYSPYGETGFGSFARERYRFTGKERDEESGLYYHGARYYAPWLARWVSCDPLGLADGLNLYAAFGDNPVNSRDPTGTQAETRPETEYEDNLKPAEGWNKLREERELKQEQKAPSQAIVAGVAPSGREVYQPNIRTRVSGQGIIVTSPSPEKVEAPPKPPPWNLPPLYPSTLKIETGTPLPTGVGEGSSPDVELPLLGHTEHPKPKIERSTPKPVERKQAASPALTEPAPKVERTLLQVFYRIVPREEFVPWEERRNWEPLQHLAYWERAPWNIAITYTSLVEADVTTRTDVHYGHRGGPSYPPSEIERVEAKYVATPYNKPVPIVVESGSVEEARQRINNPITIRLKD